MASPLWETKYFHLWSCWIRHFGRKGRNEWLVNQVRSCLFFHHASYDHQFWVTSLASIDRQVQDQVNSLSNLTNRLFDCGRRKSNGRTSTQSMRMEINCVKRYLVPNTIKRVHFLKFIMSWLIKFLLILEKLLGNLSISSEENVNNDFSTKKYLNSFFLQKHIQFFTWFDDLYLLLYCLKPLQYSPIKFLIVISIH